MGVITPLVALVLGKIILNESLTLWVLGGAPIILLGARLVSKRETPAPRDEDASAHDATTGAS